MLYRLLQLLFIALILLACDDDNFDFDRLSEFPDPPETVLIEVSEPFFRYETPDGEVFSSEGVGVMLSANSLTPTPSVSSDSIICFASNEWIYPNNEPIPGLSIKLVEAIDFGTASYWFYEDGQLTEAINQPFLTSGPCSNFDSQLEIYHSTDTTIYAHWESELFMQTDTTPNAPCDGYTSLGLFKADFFTYLTPCN